MTLLVLIELPCLCNKHGRLLYVSNKNHFLFFFKLCHVLVHVLLRCMVLLCYQYNVIVLDLGTISPDNYPSELGDALHNLQLQFTRF